MKKISLVLGIAFLLQSCFTYKNMENNPSKMIAGKTYKIERNHKCIKIIFNSRKDSTIVVTRHFEQEQIPIKEITGIRKRKFSIVKTLLLPPTIAAVLTGLFVLSYQ